ncbi:MAG: phosphotransferase family protein [Candidatus Thorarchaeota archaeon]
MLRSKLESYFKSRIPDLQDLQVNQFEEITDGWETEIYSFDIASGSGEEMNRDQLVLRMYSGPWGVYKARKEYNLLKRLQNAGYPVPEVFLIEEDSAHLGKPFILMQRIEGSCMWSLIETKDDASDLFQLFSRLFFNLHELDWHQLAENPEGFRGLDSKKAVKQWIEKFDARAKQIGSREILRIVEWLKKEMDGITFAKLSATHNDFHPNNILIDESGAAYVIDWTAADIMDFRVDLAWTLILTKIYVGDELRDEVLRGYEKVSQQKVEDIGVFEVVGALRRLTDIVVTLDVDSEEIGLRDGAAEMIREQLPQNMTLLDIIRNHTGLDLPETRKLMTG